MASRFCLSFLITGFKSLLLPLHRAAVALEITMCCSFFMSSFIMQLILNWNVRLMFIVQNKISYTPFEESSRKYFSFMFLLVNAQFSILVRVKRQHLWGFMQVEGPVCPKLTLRGRLESLHLPLLVWGEVAYMETLSYFRVTVCQYKMSVRTVLQGHPLLCHNKCDTCREHQTSCM